MSEHDDATTGDATGTDGLPEPVRAAYARLARAAVVRDDAALEGALLVLADPDADDDARAAAVERLLAVDGGREALAYLAAARRAVDAGADQAADASPVDVPIVAPIADPAVVGAIGADDATITASRPAVRAAAPAARRRPLPRWALAAAMLAVVAGVGVLARGGLPLGIGTTGETVDVTRAGPDGLALVAPRGALVAPPASLVWRPRPGRPRYTVEVIGADDAPVVIVETNDTTAAVPAAALARGDYRWFVRARGVDGSEVRSPIARFTIR